MSTDVTLLYTVACIYTALHGCLHCPIRVGPARLGWGAVCGNRSPASAGSRPETTWRDFMARGLRNLARPRNDASRSARNSREERKSGLNEELSSSFVRPSAEVLSVIAILRQLSLSWSNDVGRAKELVFPRLRPSLLPVEGYVPGSTMQVQRSVSGRASRLGQVLVHDNFGWG